MDIANYVIARKQLKISDDEENIFLVLGRESILPDLLAERMKGMVKFRNILVHDYLDVLPREVYQNLQHGLSDFDEFAKAISISST